MSKITILTTNAYDSRGIRINTALLSLAFHFWTPHTGRCAFLLSIKIGPGAGYKWTRIMGGRTAYLGLRARGGLGYQYGTPRLLRAGFTGNGNALPYSFR